MRAGAGAGQTTAFKSCLTTCLIQAWSTCSVIPIPIQSFTTSGFEAVCTPGVNPLPPPPAAAGAQEHERWGSTSTLLEATPAFSSPPFIDSKGLPEL